MNDLLSREAYNKVWSKAGWKGRSKTWNAFLATHKRLDMATLEQFDRWTDCILEASTVDAVFEEH